MISQKSFKTDAKTGTLYLIPTPIGNLDDMTYRAVKQLAALDLLLAEDTRQSIKLLQAFDLRVPMQSFHEHTAPSRIDQWIQALHEGQDIGLVSDAGMPLINDPGHPLVTAALEAGIPVVSLPGANAALTALVASGLAADRFTYYGFFPRSKRDQKDLLEQIAMRNETAIFYESPFRIERTVQQIVDSLGPERRLVIARELTKIHEHYLRGTASELADYVSENSIKGEIVLLIAGGPSEISSGQSCEPENIREQVVALIEQEGLRPNQAIKQIAKQYGLDRQTVYDQYHQLKIGQ